MGARTGKHYIESMRQKSKGMEVYLNGKRVQDVTQEPISQEVLSGEAQNLKDKEIIEFLGDKS